MSNIVFCIWLGENILEKYLIEMNTVMTELFIKNKNLKFIIYTDSVVKLIKSLMICKYELTFMLNRVTIKNIDILLEEYDSNVKIAMSKIKLLVSFEKNNLIIFNNILDNNCSVNFKLNTFFELRSNYISWSLMYPAYLHKLLHNKLYLARVSLNLRLIALSIHCGLYLDFDVLTDKSVTRLKLNKLYKIYFEYNKIVYKFKNEINNIFSANQKIYLFVKIIKKINKICNYTIQHNTFNNIDQQINIYFQNMNNRLLEEITNMFMIMKKNNSINYNTEIKDGIYSISNGINERNCNSRFSQNILFVKGCNILMKNRFINSLCFNIIISMIKPGTYIIEKAFNINYIVPLKSIHYISNIEQNIITKQLMTVLLPSDMFLTRVKYPYLTASKLITYRTGRPLHPLSQIATRGSWNFLLNEMNQLDTSREIDNSKFSVYIMKTNLYPESSILEIIEHSYNLKTHWTKIINKISVI